MTIREKENLKMLKNEVDLVPIKGAIQDLIEKERLFYLELANLERDDDND